MLAFVAFSAALAALPPCQPTASLQSSHPITWVAWNRAASSLNPDAPANSAYADVYAAWRQSPPVFQGQQVALDDVLSWITALVQQDPFGQGAQAPRVEVDALNGYVAVTQRQLAWVAARCFMGDDTSDGNELCTAIQKCSDAAQVHALLSLFAVLRAELGDTCQGAYVVAAKPSNVAGTVEDSAPMADVSACLVQDGEVLFGDLPCSGPVDFMQSNEQRQVVMDIAGANIGGGAQLCNLASQDESLMQFYPEVMALSFFSASMLHPPMMVFGARRYMNKYVGNGVPCGTISATASILNEQVIQDYSGAFNVGGTSLPVLNGVFVAQQSLLNSDDIDAQIGMWTAALSPEVYPAEILPLYCDLVHSIGTGPWGAGAWHGSSQWFFLATWLGTSAVSAQAQAKCGHPVAMDYYVYNMFCENPVAQCSVCQYCMDPSMATRRRTPAGASTCSASSCDSCKGGQGRLNEVWNSLKSQTIQGVRSQQNVYQDNAFDQISDWVDVLM
mmetsp:Transcript_45288/g.98256  ORF Transcript_45288/g.98256 Transcript_45288/m.98256 type:complete len:502 (+) Transcript_45288:16-1521(+)